MEENKCIKCRKVMNNIVSNTFSMCESCWRAVTVYPPQPIHDALDKILDPDWSPVNDPYAIISAIRLLALRVKQQGKGE